MGEYILKDMVKKAGVSDRFEIDSAAVSREEIGNSIYPPARRELLRRGVTVGNHRARQVTMADYDHFDRIYYMDLMNRRLQQHHLREVLLYQELKHLRDHQLRNQLHLMLKHHQLHILHPS